MRGTNAVHTDAETKRCALELTINRRESQGVIILDLKGRIVLGEECNALRQQVKSLLDEGQKKIVLNLGEANRVDSAGIGTLVEAVILTAKEGGRLKLINVPRLLHSSLVVHRLLQAFDIFNSEQEVLASFE